MLGFNFRWGQVLFWPRWTPFFYRGPESGRIVGEVYRWVVYVWPIEVRAWR